MVSTFSHTYRPLLNAKVYSLEDLETHKNETALKCAASLRVVGKYEAADDGDIMQLYLMGSEPGKR